jgi:hypothetical protein
MRHVSLIFYLFFSFIRVNAQTQHVLTNSGESVILFKDKTWEYEAIPVTSLLPTLIPGDIIIPKNGFTIDFNERSRIPDWGGGVSWLPCH